MKSKIFAVYFSMKSLSLVICQSKYIHNISELLILCLVVSERPVVGSKLNCFISLPVQFC